MDNQLFIMIFYQISILDAVFVSDKDIFNDILLCLNAKNKTFAMYYKLADNRFTQ